ncbi:hypothetical protein CBR_g55014, partial [Chara braunii]
MTGGRTSCETIPRRIPSSSLKNAEVLISKTWRAGTGLAGDVRRTRGKTWSADVWWRTRVAREGSLRRLCVCAGRRSTAFSARSVDRSTLQSDLPPWRRHGRSRLIATDSWRRRSRSTRNNEDGYAQQDEDLQNEDVQSEDSGRTMVAAGDWDTMEEWDSRYLREMDVEGGTAVRAGELVTGAPGTKDGGNDRRGRMSSRGERRRRYRQVFGVDVSADNVAISLVYFVQGVIGLSKLAVTFFLKDDLGLDPAEAAILSGVTTFPWLIKPLYGFISDAVPLFGYRRRSYLFGCGLLGAMAWSSLALFVYDKYSAVLAILLSSLSVAFSDV